MGRHRHEANKMESCRGVGEEQVRLGRWWDKKPWAGAPRTKGVHRLT